MRRKAAIIITLVVILIAFPIKSRAEGYTDGAIDDFRDILPEGMEDIADDTDALTERVGLRALLTEIVSILEGNVSGALAFLLSLICMGTLAALSGTVSTRLSSGVTWALGVLTSLLVFSHVGPLFSDCRSGMRELCEFFSSAIPIFTAVTVSSGATASASAQAIGMNFTVSLIGGGGISLMSSAIGMGLTVALLSFLSDDGMSALSRSVHSFFKWLSGIATALLAATVSLQNIVSSAADTAAMRAARYAVSGAIPIVGNTVSGALSTLTAGMAYARGVIGAGAVAVIISITLSPLLVLLMYRCALSLATSFVTLLGCDVSVRIYSAFRSALDSLAAVYSLCACVCIFEIVLFIKSGVSIF